VIEILRSAWHILTTADLAWVGAAVAIYAASLLAAGARWRLAVRAVGGEVEWPHASMATVAGVFVNNVTPTGRLGGEACRIAITRLRGSLSITRGALASLCDRLSDVPVVLVLTLSALPVLYDYVQGRAHLLLAIVLVILAAVLLFGRWLRFTVRTMLSSWRSELQDLPISRGAVALGFGLSALIWVGDVLRLVTVGLAFDTRFTVPQATALAVIALVGAFAPTIGGLGAVEGGLMGGLALFGVTIENAIAITTVERGISYGLSTVSGALIVSLLGGRSLLRATMPHKAAYPAPHGSETRP
jgi:hypothetical protein